MAKNIALNWGGDYARAYVIEANDNESDSWRTLFEEPDGNGKRDYDYFPSTKTKRLRIRCLKSNGGNGYALADLKLKGGDEQATPIRYYLSTARDSKLGHFPMWMNRMQEFWTTVTVP